MQNLPLVSIVTPTYNQAEYLAETIESVLAQDYPNIEYIVLDDGSTDSTPEVLNRYSGRVRWERHDNMGQARTLNKGWAMSRGEFIGYLSSDDLLLPDAISKLVETLITTPNAVVAYGDFNLIDAQGNYLRTVEAENYDRKRLTVDLVCQPGPGALFQRQILDQAGAWNVSLRQTPDFEFWLRAARLGDFMRIAKVLAQYRIHEGSASFQCISYERSIEIVEVVRNYWGSMNSPEVRRSMSNAYLIAAKNHAQSKRYLFSLWSFWQAILHSPGALISIKAWRMLASGTLRRLIFKKKA